METSTLITRFQFSHIIRGGCGLGTAFGTRNQVGGKLCLTHLLQCLASELGCYVTVVCSSSTTFLLSQCPLYTPHSQKYSLYLTLGTSLLETLSPFCCHCSLLTWSLCSSKVSPTPNPRALSSAQLWNGAIPSGGPSLPSVVFSYFLLSLMYLILFLPITFQCFLNSSSYARTSWFSGMNPMRI